MAHSIEARVPLLDHRLVEFALALPDTLKIRRGETKAVLRDAMKDALPERVRARQDKMGFETPEEIWMRSDPRFRAGVERTCDLAPQLFDRREALKLFDQKFDFTPWRIVCFGAWMDAFRVSW
jgi:asparagine synthase (glutamine-hydrolysing)